MREAFEQQTASWPKIEFRVVMLDEGVQRLDWESVFNSIEICRQAMTQYRTIHETVTEIFNAMSNQ